MTRFSFITTCKGRLEHIQQTLPLVASIESCEAIVVDYGCPDGTSDWILQHWPNVRIAKVTDDPGFCLPRARNIGASLARSEWLCFFDADVKLAPTLVAWLGPRLAPRCFYRASPLHPESWGTFVCAQADFAAIGGYDEVFRGWGGEDDDLYMRLRLHGVAERGFPHSFVEPILHDDELRTRFHSVKDRSAQNRINTLYCSAKQDITELTKEGLPFTFRQQLMEEAKKAVLASESGQQLDAGTLQLTLPEETRVPLHHQWQLSRALVYRFLPRPGAFASAAAGETEVGPAATSPKATRRRVPTRRGVVWLGQTCNLRCHFCYFLNRIEDKHHPEHAFMGLDKAKAICSTLRHHFGNQAVDIQGGEPTLYPKIEELVRHCRDIGLLPTLITNGIALVRPDACQKLKDAGLRDFLFSVQGIGDVHDEIVQVPGAFAKLRQAMTISTEIGIPVRMNCVLSKSALPQLPEIARLAQKVGARVVNFLAFNPFEDQRTSGMRNSSNVPRYADVAEHLIPALDFLDAHGIEANVRYLPLCLLPERHRKSMYNFQQLSYDIHEWDFASWRWSGQTEQRTKNDALAPVGDIVASTYFDLERLGLACPSLPTMEHINRYQGIIAASLHSGYAKPPACAQCVAAGICDGFHSDYANLFGTSEAQAIAGPAPINDPRHYIALQDKIVEPEDFGWAL